MNVTKLLVLSGLLILQSLAANADYELSRAEQLLEKDMLSAPGGVVTLTQPLRLYHYFNPAMQNGKLWPTYQIPSLRANMKGGQTVYDMSYSAGMFWDLNNHTTKLVNGGPGMYLAIDPVISKNYGSSGYIITFPAGTKYIDVSDPTWKHVSKIKLSKDTVSAMIAENIIKKSDVSALAFHNGYFTRISMQMIAATGNEKYRNSVSRIFSKNGITMVQYTWESSKLKTICKRGSSSAFVFIGDRPTDSVVANVRAEVSPIVVASTVFMSQHPVDEYTAQERQVVETTQRLSMALETGNKNSLSDAELTEVKQLTFGCE